MRTALVVPCYNEEHRFEGNRFGAFVRDSGIEVLFVDDGSSDGTKSVLEATARAIGPRASVLALAQNQGKGEAVRRGLCDALASGADIVGYADADLATPEGELVRLRDELIAHDAKVVTGARVALLGHAIERSSSRHYVGRVFATFASLLLGVQYYDTQCGAKFFRASELLSAVLETRFLSRWAFDVELLGRLLVGTRDLPPLTEREFLEVPLRTWSDVGGSKITPLGMVRGGLDLGVIGIELASLRRHARHARRASRN